MLTILVLVTAPTTRAVLVVVCAGRGAGWSLGRRERILANNFRKDDLPGVS